ncbi:Proline/betaine transporter [Candidatus Arcanobacter lacustris]|uniref:Proline/betaine transporter n=1 Tax=Candidatus Arcanibacter lacustris TaxID=1607817 RepID=A0A0F5MPL6_9RICK|nr:Proline/betaine transporter [Candidatus Arcanobacter lacustris]
MKKIVISGMIGNALEWYDFALYGQLAAIISKLYFPGTDAYTSLLLAFGVFAAGFFMRPVGGVVFGYIGDKFGRKTSLILSILCMAIPTTCIGLMPTYAQIGIFAPILLTVIRLLQGLALGGGSSGCIAFIVEHAPDNRRALAGSAASCSMGIGILCGLLASHAVIDLLPQEDFESWGWRIPFIISMFVGMIALYIRNHLHESPKYLEAKKEGKLSKAPLREVFAKYRTELFVAIGIYMNVTVPFYILVIFMNSYMVETLKYPLKEAILINAIGILSYIIITPFFAAMADKIGRKPVLIGGSVAFILLGYPIFWLLGQGGFMMPLCGQIILASIVGAYIAPIPAVLVELFPTSVRLTGVAVSYNFSAAVFGGTTPLVCTMLIKQTGMIALPAFYIMIFSILCLICLSYFKDNYNPNKALS